MKNIEFVIYLFLAFCVLASCNKSKTERVLDDLLVDPDVEIVDSIYSSRLDSSGLVYELFSPRAIVSFHNRVFLREYPKGLEIKFYNKNNIDQSTISANYAEVDNHGLASLKGDVIIESEKGDRLETSHLLWDQRYRTLQTDKLIRLIQITGDTTFGFGLEANEDFSRFSIKNGYAGKVQFDDLKTKLGL